MVAPFRLRDSKIKWLELRLHDNNNKASSDGYFRRKLDLTWHSSTGMEPHRNGSKYQLPEACPVPHPDDRSSQSSNPNQPRPRAHPRTPPFPNGLQRCRRSSPLEAVASLPDAHPAANFARSLLELKVSQLPPVPCLRKQSGFRVSGW